MCGQQSSFHDESYQQETVKSKNLSPKCLAATPVPSVPAEKIFSPLLEREPFWAYRLAKGVAIPHARVPGSDHTVGRKSDTETPLSNLEAAIVNPIDIRLLVILVPEEITNIHFTQPSRLVTCLSR